MRGDSHLAVTTEAVKLLPKSAQAFFDQKLDEDTTYLDVIREGSTEEDDLNTPRTYPINHHLLDIKTVIAEFEASAVELFTLGFVTDIRDMLDGKRADSEHFWNHEFGEIGLSWPFGLAATWRCAPARAEDHWKEMTLHNWSKATDDQKRIILFTFGRVVHLLEDMGVPVHVHGDPHPHLGDFIYDDDYEDYIEDQIEKEESYALPKEWCSNRDRDLIYYDPGWDLREQFLQMGKITVLYDSDDIDGLGSGKPYRWASIFESYDAHRDITFDLTDYACEAIARDLMPLNTSFVAGLYIRFLHAIGGDVPGLYVARLTVDELKVFDDTDPLGSGEIFIDIKLGPEGKRVAQLGRYNMDDGDRRGIGKTFSFILEEGDLMDFTLRVFDDDSWWGEPDETESLGSVSDQITYSAWEQWLDKSVSFRKLSTNERCHISYTIEILPAITKDMGRRPPLRYSESALPPLVFNIDSLCLHRSNCFCVDRMLEENKLKTYMFAHELTPDRMIKLSKEVADSRLASRLATGKAHRCGHCFLVA